jgi:hypothetical protein
MMLSSLSSLALSTLERSASIFNLTPLKFVPGTSSDTAQDSAQSQAANALANIKQIFQKYFSAQCQQVLQHQEIAQNPLTVLIPIHPEKQEPLRKYLEASAELINQFFGKSSSTHFARFVILHDESQDICQPYLLFSSAHDGSLNAYVDELVSLASAATPQADILNTIFEYCKGYTPFTCHDIKLFGHFIRRQAVKSDAFFMAYWNKTVPEIKASQSLCRELHQSLENPAFCAELNRECDRFGRLDSIQSQKPTSLKAGFLTQKLEDLLEKYWVKIRPVQNNPGHHLQPNASQLGRRLESKVIEDQIAQNQFLTLHAINPGFLGTNVLLLKVILYLADKRAKKAKGNLSGIPTIHSLRWVVIPSGILSKKPYLLFESNYNGSWDSYVDDFVQYACRRMNLIWGKCQDYQSQGAKDVEWFKQHIRNYLFPAQSYYSAYSDLTVRNILTCLRIAEILKPTPSSTKISKSEQTNRNFISLKFLLAGTYHSIN